MCAFQAPFTRAEIHNSSLHGFPALRTHGDVYANNSSQFLIEMLRCIEFCGCYDSIHSKC